MSRVYQSTKTLCCQLSQMMCWNTMKPGVLYSKSATNAGFGPLCAEERDRSFLLRLATEVKGLANEYGSEFLRNIVKAFPTAISGKPIKRFCLMKLIARLAKTVDRPITWNDGTAHCVSTRLAMSEKHYLFPKRTLSITWSPSGTL